MQAEFLRKQPEADTPQISAWYALLGSSDEQEGASILEGDSARVADTYRAAVYQVSVRLLALFTIVGPSLQVTCATSIGASCGWSLLTDCAAH